MCLQSQNWDIKFNRCFSSNPNDLICSCGNMDYTNQLKNEFARLAKNANVPQQSSQVPAETLLTPNQSVHADKKYNELDNTVQAEVEPSHINSINTLSPVHNTAIPSTTMASLVTSRPIINNSKGGQVPTGCKQGTFACNGNMIGVCNFGRFVWTSCPTGTVCRSQGASYYCDYELKIL
ncbi:hypothetical protein BDF19DRAFT_434973 [Syncephalis fuscata]|nr:hypothetical protein BDF19DRAFT_434973 [Syncephalis fuscata]